MGGGPKGRLSGLYLTLLCCGVSLTLPLSHWFEPRIPLMVFGVWEVIMYITSIISFAFLILRRKFLRNCSNTRDADADIHSVNELNSASNHSDTPREEISEEEQQLPTWTKLPIRLLAVLVCGVGSTIFPVLALFREAKDTDCKPGEEKELKSFYGMGCGRHALYVLFCVCQLIFIARFKHTVCETRHLVLLVSTVIAANFTSCISVVLDSIHEYDTTFIPASREKNGTFLAPNNTTAFVQCKNGSLSTDTTLQALYNYTYTFPSEFVLLSMPYLIHVWNIFPLRGHRLLSSPGRQTYGSFGDNASRESADTTHGQRSDEADQRYSTSLCSTIKRLFVAVSSNAVIPASVAMFLIFSLHLSTEIDHKLHLHTRSLGEFNSVIQTVNVYVICIVAFVGYVLAWNEETTGKSVSVNEAILIVASIGHLGLLLLETIDAAAIVSEGNPDKGNAIHILYYAKTVLHYFGLYSQTMLIMKMFALKVSPHSMKDGKQRLIRGMVVYIGVSNFERWIVDSFLVDNFPTVLNFIHVTDSDAFGEKNWWYITKVIYPLVILWRLQSAVLCYEACVQLNRRQRRSC